MRTLREALYGGSPFADLDLGDVPSDLSGWGSTHPIFAAAIEHYRPRRVIEVGSWKGASAIHMAEAMKAQGIDGEIVCVDTWLGAPIAWTTEPSLKAGLRLRGGYPQLYYTFAKNVTEAGFGDTITPLPAASTAGATVLTHHGFTADVIYVDADHDYGPCKRDLQAYFALLDEGGVLIADDFGSFDGVTVAVTEFAEEEDLYAVKMREKAVLSRIDVAARLGLERDPSYDRRPRGSVSD